MTLADPSVPAQLVDDPQAELVELLLGDRRGRVHHQVGARLGLREGHDLADVVDLGVERGPSVEADGDPAVRRRAVLERVEQRAELVAHALDRSGP